MTKEEFLSHVPEVIEQRSRGIARIEISADTTNKKEVCYRHLDRTESCGTNGRTWDEVYSRLTFYLKGHGYIQ